VVLPRAASACMSYGLCYEVEGWQTPSHRACQAITCPGHMNISWIHGKTTTIAQYALLRQFFQAAWYQHSRRQASQRIIAEAHYGIYRIGPGLNTDGWPLLGSKRNTGPSQAPKSIGEAAPYV
jgi:hypothetical protein